MLATARPSLLLVTLTALAACGSRSDLAVGSDPEGQGGATSTTGTDTATTATTATTSGTTTTSATVLPTGTCDVLVIDGQPLSPTPMFDGFEQTLPWLVATEKDRSRAALAVAELGNLGADLAPQAASVAFDDPWGVWPDSLGKSVVHTPNLGFVAGDGEEGRISLLTTDEPNGLGQPTGMVVWFPTAGVAGAQGQYYDQQGAGYPLFVTANQAEWLAAFQQTFGGPVQHLSLARIDSPITSGSFAGSIACATDAALSGAALPWGDGFLLALSNGRPFNTCFDDPVADGPPSRVQIAVVQEDLTRFFLTAEYDEIKTYIFQVRAAPSKTGAWIAWERIPFEPPTGRRLALLQLDEDGFPVTGLVFEVPTGTIGTPISLASLGDLPALATTREDGAGGRLLDVQVFTEEGAPFGAITLSAEPGWEMDASLSLLAAPTGDRLLVAWSETASRSGAGRVRVARLACVGGL